ncbi:MAG: BLUF domain-containing protein [Rhodospirillaceae bacterium]|nr:BLUF domain-containing protein [Rhodospirillaceae bacterium]
MSELSHYFYFSSAKKLMDQPDLEFLLGQARRNNTEQDLTGLLLYNEGCFVQYFEGPPAAVTDLISRLHSDQRHHNMIRMTEGAVEDRSFPEWSMGFATVDGQLTAPGGFELTWNSLNERLSDSVQMYLRKIMQQFYRRTY